MPFLPQRISPVIEPITGNIADYVSALAQKILVQLTRSTDPINLQEYVNMINKDPVVASCVELKALRTSIAIGNYKNSVKAFENYISDMLKYMASSLSDVAGQLSHAMPLGFSVAEIQFKKDLRGNIYLKRLNVLDPTLISFEGKKGEIEYVIYHSLTGLRRIPYKKCIHITGGFTTNFNNPFGNAECRRAIPYYKAKQVVLAEMTIAAKNNATGTWVGYADANKVVPIYSSNGLPLLDHNGNPIMENAANNLLRQLNELENNNAVVTDKDNRVEAKQIDSGEAFFEKVLNILDNQIERAFSVPSLAFNEGSASIGQGQVSNLQKGIMDNTIEAIVLQIKQQLIEKVIRPILCLRFGTVQDYGSFVTEPANDLQTRSTTLQNIISAASAQLIDPNNVAVKKKVFELLELPVPTGSDLNNMELVEIISNNQKQMELLQNLQASGGEIPASMLKKINSINNQDTTEQQDSSFYYGYDTGLEDLNKDYNGEIYNLNTNNLLSAYSKSNRQLIDFGRYSNNKHLSTYSKRQTNKIKPVGLSASRKANKKLAGTVY